jgi:uncharacterized RDD family membrane protein YckC
VNCPKCGSEGVGEVSRCRKCGYRFAASPQEEPQSLLGATSTSSSSRSRAGRPAVDVSPSDSPFDSPFGVAGSRQPARSGSAEDSEPWREELPVEKHRRRARLDEADPGASPDFDFRDAPLDAGTSLADLEGDNGIIASASNRERVGGSMALDETLEGPDGIDELGSTAAEADDWSLGPLPSQRAESGPLEVVLEDQPWNASAAVGPEASAPSAAPLGRRFYAALADAIVLLAGMGVFAAIFYAVGGRFSDSSTDRAVIAFIVVLLILVYLGAFTALASSTPGLLFMGLEVRSLDGTAPTPTDSVLRALGCLISASALMLGFAWALVDSDGLTWHDRISGTLVSEQTWQEPGA